MIEQILYYLVLLDVLIYAGLTITQTWHKRKTHHFWKNIPLSPILAGYLVILVIWLGFALNRLGRLTYICN
jgi:hypothetical protein